MSKHFPQELLQRITEVAQIEEVVADFIPLRKKGADLVGVCPKCQTKDKFSVSKGKNVAKCFKCGDKGWNNLTVISLVEYLKPCEFKEAVEHLTKKYNLEHLLEQPKVTVEKGIKGKGKKAPTRTLADVERFLGLTPKPEEIAALPSEARNDAAKKAATTIAKPSAKATKPASVRKKPKFEGSFRDQTLAESGITTEMQRGKVIRSIRNQEFTEEDFDRYQSGTLNPRKNWTVEKTNVNMVMYYLNLNWEEMTYVPKQGNKSPKPMVRCRFENPQANARSGKVAKYISPKDSGLHLWLPNKLIRDFNQSAISAGILTFQEGEKKADRMCQVAPSVGIMGIHSLAKVDDPLPLEVEQLQKKFDFDTYIFFMDADLFEIGTSKDGSVDQRPRGFANAAKKFRHHIAKFQTEGKRLNILLAHPTTLDQGIKGMDDLLESGLITDAEMQKALADGVKGIDHEYVKFYDLTLRTDAQIDELWHIDKHVSFAKHYQDQIKTVFGDEKFKLGKQWRKFDDKGNLEFDQPLLPAEEFYDTYIKKDDSYGVSFSDTKLLNFLSNRGFYRYRETAAKNEDTTFTYIRVEDNTVVKIPDFDIRDFVLEFLDDQEDKQIFVRDHFRRNHENLLGKKTFGLLPFLEPTTLKDTRDTKYLTFKTPESNSVSVWTVTKDEVKPRTLDGSDICVWRSSLIDAAPSYCGPLFHIEKITPDRIAAMDAKDRMLEVYSENIGRHTIQLTAEGEKTEFLKFLRNASNFAWKVYDEAFQAKLKELKRKDITNADADLSQQAHAYLKEHTPYTPDQEFETQQHLIAKITAIGHLIRKYRSPDSDYWIYAMEGNLVEDDQSEGRSGKSLIPTILSFVFNVAYVDGTKDMERDIYIWDKVTPQTTFVNIDDARKGKVKVTSLYSRQVGSFGVRGMNKGEVLIPYEDAPVGYMSSNFNLMPNDGSTRDRWRTLAFSDFYTDERKPQEIHEHRFWYDWDENEMQRFYSLLADCARGFLLCGGVEQGPSLMVERRRWEAELGRPFLKWADATFLFPSDNDGVAVRTGVRVPKLVALGIENEKGDKTPESWSFYGTNPEQRTYVKELDFKKKLWKWALLRGYIINPTQPNPMKSLKEYQGLEHGGDIKSVGVEYFELYEPAQLAAGKVEKKENDLPF